MPKVRDAIRIVEGTGGGMCGREAATDPFFTQRNRARSLSPATQEMTCRRVRGRVSRSRRGSVGENDETQVRGSL